MKTRNVLYTASLLAMSAVAAMAQSTTPTVPAIDFTGGATNMLTAVGSTASQVLPYGIIIGAVGFVIRFGRGLLFKK